MVGYTGAGKSTISKLLLRTYDPDAGAVRVDGIDLRDVTLDSYRDRISVVPQDAFLFKGTVASNIAYGKLDATRAEIEAAAAAVCANEVLASLPGGFDCTVDEEARNLTAAQRQLIALARAWLAGPDILVLDEATSCLDARLEQRVLEAVGRLGCTTVMVTHRDNVVAASDMVVVLDEGRVAEVGTPSELRGAGGAYDRLWVHEPEAETEREPV
jgi:ATP-binding cassette subfamily B protein